LAHSDLSDLSDLGVHLGPLSDLLVLSGPFHLSVQFHLLDHQGRRDRRGHRVLLDQYRLSVHLAQSGHLDPKDL
jgi:hypothetical protein